MTRSWKKLPATRGRVKMYGICYRPNDYISVYWGFVRLNWEKS